MNYRDDELDGEKIQQILDKLGLTALVPHFMAIFKDKNNMKINISCGQDLYSQYADVVLKQVNENKNEDLMDECLALINTMVYYESIQKEFNSTMFMIEYCNENYKSTTDAGKVEENLLSPTGCDNRLEMKDLSSSLSHLKSSFDSFKTNLSKLDEMKMKLNSLTSKLKKYQILPCNEREIQDKISALTNEIGSM